MTKIKGQRLVVGHIDLRSLDYAGPRDAPEAPTPDLSSALVQRRHHRAQVAAEALRRDQLAQAPWLMLQVGQPVTVVPYKLTPTALPETETPIPLDPLELRCKSASLEMLVCSGPAMLKTFDRWQHVDLHLPGYSPTEMVVRRVGSESVTLVRRD